MPKEKVTGEGVEVTRGPSLRKQLGSNLSSAAIIAALGVKRRQRLALAKPDRRKARRPAEV